MSTTPLISCIIIFLNAEVFIEEAIVSVIEQTYESWELLLVDDGSSDSSGAIAQSYAATYPDKIRYLDHPGHQNLGMSASRNLGIQHAKGDYVAFLDADDCWVPTKLTEQMAIMATHPEAAMVYGRSRYWYSWSRRESERDYLSKLGAPSDTSVFPPHLLMQFLRSAGGPSLGSTLIRRSFFTEVGQFETAFRGMCEDQVFFAKVFLNAPVFAANQCWHDYRQHADSCSASMLSRPSQDFIIWEEYLTWLEAYLVQVGCQDPEINQLVQTELAYYRNPHLRSKAILFIHFKRYLRQAVSSIVREPLLRGFDCWRQILLQRNQL